MNLRLPKLQTCYEDTYLVCFQKPLHFPVHLKVLINYLPSRTPSPQPFHSVALFILQLNLNTQSLTLFCDPNEYITLLCLHPPSTTIRFFPHVRCSISLLVHLHTKLLTKQISPTSSFISSGDSYHPALHNKLTVPTSSTFPEQPLA